MIRCNIKNVLLLSSAIALSLSFTPDAASAGIYRDSDARKAFSILYPESNVSWVPTLEEAIREAGDIAWVPAPEEASALEAGLEIVSAAPEEMAWVPSVYEMEAAAEPVLEEVAVRGLHVISYDDGLSADSPDTAYAAPDPMPVGRKESEQAPEEVRQVFAASVSNEELDGVRGTNLSAETLGTAVLEAVSAHNSSQGSVTGSNVISNDVFGNAQGIATVIQNSGNNVIIQSATVVNLSLSN